MFYLKMSMALLCYDFAMMCVIPVVVRVLHTNQPLHCSRITLTGQNTLASIQPRLSNERFLCSYDSHRPEETYINFSFTPYTRHNNVAAHHSFSNFLLLCFVPI